MKNQFRIDAEALVGEIARYLAAVDTFRAENSEPTWRMELAPCPTARVMARGRTRPARSRFGSTQDEGEAGLS